MDAGNYNFEFRCLERKWKFHDTNYFCFNEQLILLFKKITNVRRFDCNIQFVRFCVYVYLIREIYFVLCCGIHLQGGMGLKYAFAMAKPWVYW